MCWWIRSGEAQLEADFADYRGKMLRFPCRLAANLFKAKGNATMMRRDFDTVGDLMSVLAKP